MRKVLGVACFASALIFATGSWAADVEPVQGDLSVNQGQGFQKVNGRIEANVGDSFMVGPDGSATVSYPDGCQVSVQPGAVTTIAPLSPCASGSFAQVPPPPNPLLTTILIGGAIGGIVGIAVAVGQQHGTTPASP
jgi:hypothetical protein